MATTTVERHPKGKGAWYFIYVCACVLCNRTTVERERRHDPRPDNPADRHEYAETACSTHFL